MPGKISGASASTEATLTIAPSPSAAKRGATAAASRVTAVTLSADELLQRVEVRLAEAAGQRSPALLTSMPIAGRLEPRLDRAEVGARR